MTTNAKKAIEIPDFISVRELASLMDSSPITIIKELMRSGIMANINQQIDFDTAAIVAEELGFQAVPIAPEVTEEEEATDRPAWRQAIADEKEVDLVPRPPVVTMLGHVDHGKTSLLDLIRHTNVVAGEAGGITQHVGAYQAEHNGQVITFLDTPGHEAFTAMRARGAQATDIAILVIAADDGVMPQTREAIDHARAARVPIIVALNKIDLPSANPNRVRQQLAEIGLTPDEWEGDTLVIEVSAKEQWGIDDLLEAILLTAEELNPRANPEGEPTGTVIEASMEKGRGVMTTLLVQNGTVHRGDVLLIGDHYGKIRSMFDYRGNRIKEAGPSMPISVSGLSGMPSAGDQFEVIDNEREARKLAEEREVSVKRQDTSRQTVSLEDFFAKLVEGEPTVLNLIIKADVQGSLEPIVSSLEKLNSDEVTLDILRAATGNISENDIMLASASDAVVLGFNVSVDTAARMTANAEGVEIKTYNIIYKLLEDIEKAMKGLLAPVYEEQIIGRAEVRQVFRVRGVGQVAGSFMRTGEGRRNANARLIRDESILYEGPVASLKHLQENVREIKAGFEFGVSMSNWDDYEPGDIIEFFVTQKVQSD
jgi:translation initiation factor IF-2